MGDRDDAHDPSARCAGTSRASAQGGVRRSCSSSSIAGTRPEHHIMQAMPQRILRFSTVPLLMPYIQRRPETVGGKAFKLVSDYTAGRRPARGDPPASSRA